MQIQATEDGSHTLYSEAFDEIYHSRRGAWQESNHVFIQAGLAHSFQQKEHIHLLEIGLGTGLNAILTAKYIYQQAYKVYYVGLEPIPVPLEIITQLNYGDFLEEDFLKKKYLTLHQSAWNETIHLTENFDIYKSSEGIMSFEAAMLFDLVYFDAFAPTKQAEMWTTEVFSKIYTLLSPNGIFVTYCSKGIVKRALESVGFQIEKLPGPKGKREMLRGMKM